MQSATKTVIQNRYILRHQLGTGSMGAVFVADDRLTGDTVALKRVHRFPEQALPLAVKLAVTNEFELLASLRHPNIVNVIDYGIDGDGMPFFTMNYLQQAENFLVAARRRSLHENVGLLVQVVDALRYLRRRGIVHRDLKPDNLLVAGNTVHLLDFGLAIARTLTDAMNADISGTIAYMAPEVLSGEAPSFASDQYALGVIAYEVFAGRPLIRSSGTLQQLAATRCCISRSTSGRWLQGWPVAAPAEPLPLNEPEAGEGAATVLLSPEELRNSLAWIGAGQIDMPNSMGVHTHPLVPIIGRMLMRDPAARYPDAEEITADLCAAIGQSPRRSLRSSATASSRRRVSSAASASFAT
jgi:serine/threonine protein kinase